MRAKATVKVTPQKRGKLAQRRDRAVVSAKKASVKPAVVLGAGVALEAAHLPYVHVVPWAWATAGAATYHYGREAVYERIERRSGGKRAARQRRKFQGTATHREIRSDLSAAAARKGTKVTRPSLAGATRGLAPAEAGVVLGTTAGRRKRVLVASHEDMVLLYGGPRTGKTAVECGQILDAPGACISTSTRTDAWAHTVSGRSAKGPVWVLNPDGDGDLPTNFALSPLTGCWIPQVALESAGYLMDAAPSDKNGKDKWWDARGAELLRLAMHAAAISGATMREAAMWVRDPQDRNFMNALLRPDAAPGWAHELDKLRGRAPEQVDGISTAAAGALGWMADPFMAAVACPQGDEFDAVDFICSAGTLYLIAADKPHGSVAPYCAWLTAHIWNMAKRVASRMPGGRLDPPLRMVLDEPAITCPVPLPRWSAEAGGHGITIITGFQSPAQLSERWGEHGAKAIRDCATVKLILRGRDDHAELEPLSAMCGERDSWQTSAGEGSTGLRASMRTPVKVRVFPPEQIRTLKPWHAILLHRSTRPLEMILTPVWERDGYQRAGLGPDAFRTVPESPLAIEAPLQREAIPMPGAAAPAVADSQSLLIEENHEWQKETQQATSRSLTGTG